MCDATENRFRVHSDQNEKVQGGFYVSLCYILVSKCNIKELCGLQYIMF